MDPGEGAAPRQNVIAESLSGAIPSGAAPVPAVAKPRWWWRTGSLVAGFPRRHPLLFCVVVLAVAAGAIVLSQRKRGETSSHATATAFRGNLEILVLEGGNVQALESLELKSQVESREGTKILSIVDEGYEVTPEDVEAEKVLIRLDPTEVKEKIEEHDVEFENAQEALTESDEARAIQATESENAIKVARQAVRFALLDLEKYLGEHVSDEVLDMRGLPSDEEALRAYEDDFRVRLLAGRRIREDGEGASGEPDEPEQSEVPAEQTDAGEGESTGEREISDSAEEGASAANSADSVIDRGEWVPIDFSRYLEADLLGDGEAQQELRKLQDELLVAQSEHAVERENVTGSERLADQAFITRATLDKQRVALKKAEIRELSAGTQLELFRRYEFPKSAEERLTTYEDALHGLDQAKKEALAKLAQAEAKFRSAEQVFRLAKKKRDDLAEQLENCTIVASKPGLVVYGSSNRNPYYSSDEKIEEGAAVRYKRTIITIPDMRRMSVEVSIQESHIKKVAEGQKARIVTEAESDKVLTGEVKKVAVLPDSNRWYDNPNQKVYPTEIHIDGTHGWLKPGMSAKVEIVVEELEDVLQVPLQAVMVDAGDKVVYVENGGKADRRVVEVGAFNDEFIEIVDGLRDGESVRLSKPSPGGGDADSSDREEEIEASVESDVAAETGSETAEPGAEG